MRRLASIALRILIGLAGVVVLLGLAGIVTVQTQWFRDRVRDRIILEVKDATGGRAELRGFRFDWPTLTAQVRGFTVHGKESPKEQPLFRAESVQVTLRILSVLRRRVDLYEVVVRRPEVNIIVYENGTTNLPAPQRAREARNTVQTVLDLAIKRFNLAGGTIQYAGRRIPLDVLGENLHTQIVYDAGAAPVPQPRYRGSISFENVAVQPGGIQPFPLALEAKFALDAEAVYVESARIALKSSYVDMRGRVADYASPRAELDYSAHITAGDIKPVLRVRAVPVRGTIDIHGKARISAAKYTLSGTVRGTGLEFEPQPGIRLAGVDVQGGIKADPEHIGLTGAVVRALGGRFEGSAELSGFRDLRVDGTAQGFAADRLAAFLGLRRPEWSGTVSGPVQLAAGVGKEGVENLDVRAQLGIAPARGPNPVEGAVSVRYARGEVTLDPSWLATPGSRIEAKGALSRRLEVAFDSRDLRDIDSAFQFVRGRRADLPLRLAPDGSVHFQGAVTNVLKNESIEGRFTASNFNVSGRDLDFFSGTVRASASGLSLQSIDARKQQMRGSGWVQVGLRDWKLAGSEPLTGEVSVRAADIRGLLAELNQNAPMTGGPIEAKVTLAGTVAAPQAAGNVQASKIVAWGQPVAALDAQFRYRDGLVEASPAIAQIAGSRVRLSGSYAYEPGAPAEGRLRFDVNGRSVQLAQVDLVQRRSPDIAGRIEAQLAGDIALQKSGFRINAISGSAAARNVALGNKQLGSFMLAANTREGQAEITMKGKVSGAEVAGLAQCKLSGDYPVRGSIDFTGFDYAALIEHLREMPANDGLPFEGTASGRIEFAGSTTKPETLAGNLQVAEFEMRADPGAVAVPNAARMVFRNTGPMIVDFNTKFAQIRQAVLRGPNTDLTLGGRVSFTSKNPFDLRIRGEANLAVLKDIKPRLESSGTMLLDISIRGRSARPDIYGRLDMKDASFDWPGLPNGIANANGLMFVYRDRVSIDSLTAEIGGGKVNLSGFIGFGSDPTFHLVANAEHVRVRYPEGVSSSADANLTLTGTTEHSMLSGDVTVTRVGFNPRSDLASILASTAEPIGTPPEPNRLLQGMQLNVHIVTSPQARVETKLTRDIQADADLRLRGNPNRPVVLGRVLVNQGEVIFFGNQYEIQSGQIVFVNASKIEPIVNLDLQTHARSIDITVHVSGPVDKLNLTYRSDPPLQFTDIVALLATGRQPDDVYAAALDRTQRTGPQSFQQAGASAILSQALANPLAGRLQRLFGVSRLKIDPQISGVTTNNAAARVTLEQQVSRNITFTYITDLTRPQAQSVRVECDLTRNWSAVAQREESGLFGIDFLYKKQFK